MKTVNDMNLYPIIKGQIAKGMRTNFFLSEEELMEYIQNGMCQQLSFADGTYLFLEDNEKIRFFYCLEKEGSINPLPEVAKPIILEEVHLATKEKTPSEADWMSVGFVPYLVRKRLRFLQKNWQPEECQIEFATIADTTTIMELMSESFEPYTSALPSVLELERDILAKRVLVAKDEDNLLGFLRFGLEKKNTVLWQIAVAKEGRGQGVGGRLVQDWMFANQESRQFLLWVRTDNPSALKMYENLGFQSDGRLATVMIKNEKTGAHIGTPL
ncbi:GNAT family N-acetyltransferase [Chakrabartyella piscis]|uniref:GNAT family N-acetyltransferase n=1 Tax=Chakrabartyella piscis TaxID=2918914 RepID=UPI002958A5D0|nr:GNAT family N-acetyltransferase [Chakrabartyella piscis]